MKNIVVFASGGGSNFQSIIDAIASGTLTAKISGFITNTPEAFSLQRANNHDIPSAVISSTNYSSNSEYEQALISQLESFSTDFIVLAGYLRKIPSCVIERYKNRILNIHPSLLPKYGGKGFYGRNVHRSVIENGEEESGCTVHLVSEIYDEGPILEQVKLPVYENDTPESLAERVLREEHILYPKVIAEYLKSFH